MSPKTKSCSGKTFIADGMVVWEHSEKRIVEIPICKIKLLAEYTKDSGPWREDWFLIIYYDQSQYFEVSMYADNIEETINELGKRLSTELDFNLANSTGWKSYIIYPSELKGRDLWKIIKMKPESFLDKLKALVGINKIEVELTHYAKTVIE